MKERLKCILASGPTRMTRCGIGPRFSIITVVCGIVTGWLSFKYPTLFMIQSIPSWLFVTLGSVLVVTGMIIYVIALQTFNPGYRNKRLVIHGLYAFMRHPIYFAWIWLICPGVVLCFHTWLMLLLPCVAYLSFKVSIPLEDRDLEHRFGQAYRDYKSRTPELFPTHFIARHRHQKKPHGKAGISR